VTEFYVEELRLVMLCHCSSSTVSQTVDALVMDLFLDEGVVLVSRFSFLSRMDDQIGRTWDAHEIVVVFGLPLSAHAIPVSL